MRRNSMLDEMATEPMVEAWEQFKGALECYGNALSLLKPPCSVEHIQKAESRFNLGLPNTLKKLLTLNNGQLVDDRGAKSGLFKSVSGWDVYERHIFLDIEGIETAYKTFIDDKLLTDEFGLNEIPFAVAGSPKHYREAFCINCSTHAVSLIRTEVFDPFSPPEWQVWKFNRAETLMEFIEKQIELYR